MACGGIAPRRFLRLLQSRKPPIMYIVVRLWRSHRVYNVSDQRAGSLQPSPLKRGFKRSITVQPRNKIPFSFAESKSCHSCGCNGKRRAFCRFSVEVINETSFQNFRCLAELPAGLLQNAAYGYPTLSVRPSFGRKQKAQSAGLRALYGPPFGVAYTANS